MATREKKARSVTADSPTPSLGSANSGSNGNISVTATTPSTGVGSDSTPTTPTSTRKAAAASANVPSTGASGTGSVSNVGGSGSSSTSSSTTRGSLSRLKSKQQLLQQSSGEDAIAEDTIAFSSETLPTTPSRTTRGGGVVAAKEDASLAEAQVTMGTAKDRDDADLTKSAASGAGRKAGPKTANTSETKRRIGRPPKNRVGALKHTTLLKRKGKKIIGKPMLGRKAVGRRQLVLAAKSAAISEDVPFVAIAPLKKDVVSPSTAAKEKEEDAPTTPSLRNGKPRNSDSPVAKRKSTAGLALAALKQDLSKSSDSLVATVKLERRLSVSITKCFDVMDDGDQAGLDAKRDLLDYDSRNKMLDKMAEAFNDRKSTGGAASPVVAGSKDDKGQGSGGALRRSMRQRKSTARDKEDFLPPRGRSGMVDVKMEPAELVDSMDSSLFDGDGENAATSAVAAPLTIDTAELDVPIEAEPLHSDGTASSVENGSGSVGVSVGEEELAVGKDPSLSPGELISEGVSEQSVKECYSEPAFMENNLGIEKDPKLGEIVQERFRCDKVSDESDGANAENDARSAKGDCGGGVLEDVPVTIGEEAMSTSKAKEKEVPTAIVSSIVDTVEGENEKQAVQGQIQVADDDDPTIMDIVEIQQEAAEVVTKPGRSEDDYCDDPNEQSVMLSGNLAQGDEMDTTVVSKIGSLKKGFELLEDDAMMIDEKSISVKVEESFQGEKPMEQKDCSLNADDDANGSVDVPQTEIVIASSKTQSECNVENRLTVNSPIVADGGVSGKTNGETIGTNSNTQSTSNQHVSRGQPKSSNAAGGTVTSKTPKSSASTGSTSAGTPGSGKETKSKTRVVKEKSKEDEKTREEKLRQEKLRVEEKVREEKLRAERQEAEMRLKEELLQQHREGGKLLENGLIEDVSGSRSGGSSPASQTDQRVAVAGEKQSVAEKDPKTESNPAAPKANVISLGGLNLPAITIAITKKDSGSGASDEKDENGATAASRALVVPKVPKAELEILPIKPDGLQLPAVVLLSKEEKPAKEAGGGNAPAAPTLAESAESPLRIISKSESAAAAVTATDRRDSNKSPVASLSIIKIESNNGSPTTTGSTSPPSASMHLSAVEDAKPVGSAVQFDESDDAAKRKESHLKHLGLLTIRAACEEKQRRAEQKPAASSVNACDSFPEGSVGGAANGGDGWLAAASSNSQSGGSGGRSTGSNKSSRSSRDEYTVSMKTVLKGGNNSRGEKRKQQRMPLKMTFQKGKGKSTSTGGGTTGRDSSNGSGTSSSNGCGYATDSGNNGDTAFYTVHSNELDHHSSNSSDSHRDSGASVGRKAHSRSHTTDGIGVAEPDSESVSTKEVSQKSLVIPEKASSFNVHPGRLCQDQCSYCGGRFGLYDTPCHVAAMKSNERQQRILNTVLPKITLDSCLCDACYRHVDRKANCPPQKKKSASVSQSGSSAGASVATTSTTTQSTVSPLVIKMTTNKDGSTSIATEQPATMDDAPNAGGRAREICAVRQCTAHALQSLRRKWVLKMKRKIGKHLDINLEQAAKTTAEFISICNKHYEQISHLMICAICTKPLQKNLVYYMYNNIPTLERLIQQQGISMSLGSSELVVCKLCKYYANLLLSPPTEKSKKAQFVKDYNRRLYNLRQRAAEDQEEQNARVQNVETTVVITPRHQLLQQHHPVPVDIVISDGDEEAAEAEEEEGDESSESQQQDETQYLGNLFPIGDSSVSLRRRVSNRKSPEVTIVENNGGARMGDLGEITIIPTSKSAVNQSHQQRDDNIDMTKVLKSNPNISMRELFPGEEELGVHVNIPFSSSSARTPEGWTKVTSTIQYDDSTRSLWEELQKPYGNQSSFLRHLILLEKYFRNGDLVLSPQAKNNATTYSEAVQNRLRSFDNIQTPSSPPALASLTSTNSSSAAAASREKASNIFQQFSSATITIVPATKARPRAASMALSSGSSAVGNSSETTPISPPAPVSLLKSNNMHLTNSGSEHTPKHSLKRKLSIEAKLSGSGGNSHGATPATSPPAATSGGSGVENRSKVVKLDDAKTPSSTPPELISINRKPSVTITTIPTATLTTAGPPPSAGVQKQQSLLNPSQQSLLQNTPVSQKKVPAGTTSGTTTATPSVPNTAREIIQMPEQLTEAERRESSPRNWRPTLLPIAPGVTESLKVGPLYQTADGRLLPMLVQVMSGGKAYHISIEDYNRMCILRREKLLLQQHNMMQTATRRQPQLPQPKQGSASPAITVAPPPPALRLVTSSVENSLTSSTVTANSLTTPPTGSGKMVQLPNQLLEQNSLIPILGGSGANTNKAASSGTTNSQKNNSSSLTVTMTTTVNNNSLAKTSTLGTAAMKSLSLPNSTTVLPMMVTANTISLPSSSVGVSLTSSLSTGASGMTTQASSSSKSSGTSSLLLSQPVSYMSAANCNMMAMNPFDQLLKGGNLVTQAQLQEFVAATTAANGATSLMENPAQLLSKIPKSLTVIPQQKQRSMSRVSSNEDQSSA
ncbi:uncharacterized protein LOC128721201 [Anopheles nili]|uniref:uncharacterized protein LOC128721201 n=1 Tax=Anopheles nili TaxID=185578 RepID=UPI00237B4FCD|nr:uncharacterized protein LOC128721201 [Anopheles nili]